MLLHPSFFALLQLARQLDIPVSPGHIIPPHAFRYFMHTTGLDRLFSEKLNGIKKPTDKKMWEGYSVQFRQIALSAKLPRELSEQLYECYFSLGSKGGTKRQSLRIQSVFEPFLGAVDYPLVEEYGQDHIAGPAIFLDAMHQSFAGIFSPRVLELLAGDPYSAGILAVSVGLQVQPVFTDEVFGTCYRLLGPSSHIIRLSAAYGSPVLHERLISGADVFHVEETADGLKVAFHQVHSKPKMWLTPECDFLEPLVAAVTPAFQNKLCVSEEIIMKVVNAFKKIEDHMTEQGQFNMPPFLLWKVNSATGQPELLNLKRF